MITAWLHARARRRIEQLIAQGLPPRAHRDLRRHLRDCDDCREHYERLRRVEETLGGSDGLAMAAIDRLADLVVPAPAFKPVGGWMPLALGSAVAAAVLIAMPMTRAPEDEFTARGGLGKVADVSLHAYRMDAKAGTVSRLVAEHPEVRAGDLVQLAYSNANATHAVVVGVDASYGLQWYQPAEPGSSQQVRTHATEEPFEGAWNIDAAPGTVRLYAIFDDAPIAASRVEAAVEGLHRAGASLERTASLPGFGERQSSVLLRVVP